MCVIFKICKNNHLEINFRVENFLGGGGVIPNKDLIINR